MKLIPTLSTLSTRDAELVTCRDRNPVLDHLREQRQSALDGIDAVLATANAREDRTLTESERATLEQTRSTVAGLDAQIEPLAELEQLRSHSTDAVRRYSTTPPAAGGDQGGDDGRRSLAARTEPRGHEYRSAGEVLVDLLTLDRSSDGAKAAGRSSVRLSDDQKRAAQDRLEGAMLPYAGMGDEHARAVAKQTTTETPGLLPQPVIGEVIKDVDAARPFVSSIGAKDLGSIAGTSFKRPTVTQSTQVGKQTAEKAELPSRQFKVDSLEMSKETYGGTLNVSRQDIDWTSPAAWDAILTDLQEQYALTTEEVAATAFVTSIPVTGTGVPAAVAVATDDLKGWARALFTAAAGAYQSAKRLPDTIWCSLDMWALMGSIVDAARLSMRNGAEGIGSGSSPRSFEGSILDVPRVVVPSFPDGTIVVGPKNRTEFYEERIGLLQAVEPRLLGVEIAYGGYVAYGTLKPTAFRKITKPA